MNLKRLNTFDDEGFLRIAFSWNIGVPTWVSDMDSVFGPQDADDFIKACETNILVGIFNPDFCGLLILEPSGKDVFAAHLCAKRGTPLSVLTAAASRVIDDFLALGMVEGFCWVAEKNLAVRRLCDTIGMTHEGILMYRGTYKGFLIKWMRYSVKAQAVSQAVAA